METTETITIPKSIALSILNQLEAHVKPQLEAFVNPLTKWQDLKSFEQAAAICPPDQFEQAVLSLTGSESNNSKAIRAFVKLSIVSRAMNKLNNDGEIWEPDWSDDDECKYYPWLEYKAGSGFSDYDYYYVITSTGVGSRLCFMESEMARHAAATFPDLYNDLFTL